MSDEKIVKDLAKCMTESIQELTSKCIEKRLTQFLPLIKEGLQSTRTGQTAEMQALQAENEAMREALEGEIKYLKGVASLIVDRNPVDSSIVQDLALPLRVRAAKLQKQTKQALGGGDDK